MELQIEEPADTPMAESVVVSEVILVEDNDVTPGPAIAKKKKQPRRKISVVTPEADQDVEIVDDPSMPIEPRLPIGRVKNFMKMCPDGKNMAVDAVYLMTKATEMFIQDLGRKSWAITEHAHRKAMALQDMRLVIDTEDNLRFLEDMLT
ncbi:hypothetical protein BV898_07584 [Hypsibius exemplaris]|uniref:Transcription factor CBF/NF-Y/archaeal histone domain-containing protein n=1 Tax=Hypsibius exemplaris TaxID=2072580 RepID=A0A1W0WT74_HYPEX|nr:hypothetical protein BV898_07584 [Hypsibius exemplaris]